MDTEDWHELQMTNSELRGTDYVQRQISEHIISFKSSKSFCVYLPSNIFRSTLGLLKIGEISQRYSPVFSHVTHLDQPRVSITILWISERQYRWTAIESLFLREFCDWR